MNDPLYKEAERTRTLKSYLIEWKAHNTLYNWGLFRSRTANVDLDENEKRMILYYILSIFE